MERIVLAWRNNRNTNFENLIVKKYIQCFPNEAYINIKIAE